MWFLLKNEFLKCEFCENWYFETINFWVKCWFLLQFANHQKESRQCLVFVYDKFDHLTFKIAGQKASIVGSTDRKGRGQVTWLLWSLSFWKSHRRSSHVNRSSMRKYSITSLFLAKSRRGTWWGSDLGPIIVIPVRRVFNGRLLRRRKYASGGGWIQKCWFKTSARVLGPGRAGLVGHQIIAVT